MVLLVVLGLLGVLALVAVVVIVVRALRGTPDDVIGAHGIVPPADATGWSPPTGQAATGSPAPAPGPASGRVDPTTPAGAAGLLGDAVGGDSGAIGMGDLGSLVRNLQAAMADGGLSDENLTRLFPGAHIQRQDRVVQLGGGEGLALDWDDEAGEHHHVEWAVGPVTTTSIQVDGQVVDDLSQIPDPAVRARVEQVLRQLGR